MANLPPKIRGTVFLAIALLALAVRLPRLGERPMHTDEAVNAYIVGQLLAGDAYHYDPQDRHGPVLYAIAWPIARLAGAKTFSELTEASVRIGPVIIGALAVLLFAAFATQIGFPSAAVAALFYAISPLFVYYSRDFIHETFFITATLAAIVSGFRLLEKASIRNGILFGVSTGFMLACKETAVIHFAAFGIAALAWPGILRRREQKDFAGAMKSALAALASFCLVLVIFYTWGGSHVRGLWDLMRAVPNFTARAGGQGHEKPAWYYFVLLGGGWSGAILLALAALGALSRKVAYPNALRVLVVYTIAIILLYSAIPYKTPWLALNLCLPIILLAGIGIVSVCGLAQGKSLVLGIAVGTILICGLCHDTWRRVFFDPTGERNPYAYAQTVEDVARLPIRIKQLAAASHHELRIAVIAADPWPLPWYLREFPQVGFWQPDQFPAGFDLYITSPEAATTGPQLTAWRPEFFGIRPEVLVVLWQPPVPEERQ